MLRDGQLHLSGIAKLAPHLTGENHRELLARAAHKSKRQIEELLVELTPTPDVPAVIRKLPTPARPVDALQSIQLGPDRVRIPDTPAAALPTSAPPRPPRPVVEPLSPARYKLQLSIGEELRDKLERLKALMRVELEAALEAAVTEKLERLEAKRYAATKTPRKNLSDTDTSGKSRYMPAAVKRMVWKRDQQQCTFMDGNGRRCPERQGLEFHHDDPFGLGGDHDPARVRLLCRSHNLYFAERDYGKEIMARFRRKGDRVSETTPLYGLAESLCGPRSKQRWWRA
jgi:hypothetical protein